MKTYASKLELITEIKKRATLFIDEFLDISGDKKHTLIDGVDKTPYQIIVYQIGWMKLILSWEEANQNKINIQTPKENIKWNQLGILYEGFYKEYSNYSLEELIFIFNKNVADIIDFIDSLSEKELFQTNQRQWASSTKSNWPIWKWLHINSVAPFTNFRVKIRK